MAGLARAVLLVVAATLGCLFAVGSALAALFEMQGFGRTQAGGPRPAYLALLAFGFVGSGAAPALCWWLLYRWTGRRRT